MRCFIGDAPARAFILNHFGHNSSNAFSKCKVEGRRCIIVGFEKTMVFLGIEHERRTNDGYENLLDEDHHKGRSPLSPFLPLVTHVPFECMQSVYLGNVKKTISAQVEGKFGFRRLSGRKLAILNSRMIDLQLYCPSDFNRRPQEFTKFHRFKATEFCQFLLYTAPAVVKDVLEEDYYNHLMILHVVMRLLVSEETSPDMYDFCEESVKTYVSLSSDLYGEQFLSYNVHSALHLVDDVRVLGPIETFSAFVYENNLQQLRKWIRKPGLKLPQIYKRISEKDDYALTPVEPENSVKLSQVHAEGPLPPNLTGFPCQQFKKVEVGEHTLSTSLRDSCCYLKNGSICIIKNIIRIRDEIRLIVRYFQSTTAIYDVGIASTEVNLYKCQTLNPALESISLNDVKSKSYLMPLWSSVEGEEEQIVENEWVCASLLSAFLVPDNVV